MTEVVALRPKTYAYLIDGYDNDNYEKNKIIKKAKGTKKCVIKQKLMFQNYKDCLFNNNIYKLYVDHRKDLKAIIIISTQKN